MQLKFILFSAFYPDLEEEVKSTNEFADHNQLESMGWINSEICLLPQFYKWVIMLLFHPKQNPINVL